MFYHVNEDMEDVSKSFFDKDLKMVFRKPSPSCAHWVIFGRQDSGTSEFSFPLEDSPISLEK